MEKFKVSFEANNQQLKSIGTKHASDTYADIEASFVLGEKWTDMDSVSAVWWNDFTRVATVLDSQGKCVVPHEVLTRKGCVRVNLVGSIVEGDELVTRLTSYSAEAVQVNEKIKLTGSETSEVTPSQYEQFVANVKADANRAEQSATDAKAYADEAEASAQNASESASASAVSASDSARSATASAGYAQDASESAQSAENAKDDAEDARDEILGMRATAETLEAGSDATASYSDGLLTLGIPRGDRGEQGIQGETGATPNLTIGTVETLEPTEDATATITGTAEEPVLNLGIPKGDTGEVSRAELDNAVSDLKSDLNAIVIRSSNRLNMDTVTLDWIDANGTVAPSVNYHATDFIPVAEGETIYFWCEQSTDHWAAFDTRQLVAYDSAKQAVAASAVTWATSYTVPSGIAFVRLNIANSYFDWSNMYVGSLQVTKHDEYLPYNAVKELVNQSQVDENTSNISINTANIEQNASDIAHITEPSSNLLDKTQLIPKYIPADGSINDATLYHATDYLPVSEGESIYAWGKSDGAYISTTYRFVCAYDENKVAVPSAGYNSETTPPYVVPNGIKYVRFTLYDTALDTFDNMYIGTHPVGVDYEDFGVKVKIPSSGETSYTVHNGGSILAGVKYCYANDIKNLVIEAGTYDVIEEYKDYYGDSYFDDYIDYAQGDIFDAGIWLQNISVKFEVGAKVICKYTGANTNVNDYFSAFATGNNVTIDGLVLDAENLRYGIHADYNSGSTETFFIVKNCDLKNVRSDGNKCIGAGLGKHVFWLFENTIFRTTGNYYAMRIHNSVNSEAESKIIVKDCYIDGAGYFIFNAYSTSTKQTIIQVCGCSYETAPVVGRETVDSNDNFTMIAWNNELRS